MFVVDDIFKNVESNLDVVLVCLGVQSLKVEKVCSGRYLLAEKDVAMLMESH